MLEYAAAEMRARREVRPRPAGVPTFRDDALTDVQRRKDHGRMCKPITPYAVPMETKVFTFELMGPDRLAVKQEGSGAVSYLDDVLAEGWTPLHWENASDASFVRYRAIMARKKPTSCGLHV